jgi:putative endopeptidase
VNKRLIAVSLATLAGCGSSKPASPTTPATPDPTPVATPTPTPAPPPLVSVIPSGPKPEIGAWGFDLAGMDQAAAPGASFHKFANGTWDKTTQIPADKSNYGMFSVLADRSEERTRKIIEGASGAPGTDGQRIADYYKAFMDEAAIEAKGLAPVKPWLDQIAGIKDTDAVVAQLAVAGRQFGTTPVRAFVEQDERAPDKYIASLAQGGLGLPDRDMYDANAAQFASRRDGYKKYIATMFTLIGAKDADARAAAVYALEEKLAQTHWTKVANRDSEKTYNKLTPAELDKLAPGVSWKAWLGALGLGKAAAFNVHQPSAIAGAAALIKSEPVAVWKDYLTLHALTAAAPFLPKRFVDAHFEMFGKVLTGTPELRERWKRAVDLIAPRRGGLGEAVGKLYVEKYFTAETKAAADALVGNLLVAMGQRLDALDWMGAETKAKAKAKLATYNPKIGYPRKWRDYKGLKIAPGDALGNAQRVAQFDYAFVVARLGKPVDRDEWGMTPMTINAYYNPVLNEIVFPAAILQPPFFDPNADPAVNYGGIGAVIGHEISHGFDDQGAKYDATGTLKNWWTDDDQAKFKTSTAKLVAQYSAYCPIPAAGGKPAQCVKGELTLGENIADLAGLTIAYNAYKLSLGGKPAPIYDGMTGDQRFFLGWAQVWRRLYRDEEYVNRLITDEHSPSEFRVSVVRNLDAWYEAFQPKPGDALYLPPAQRVRIW